MKVKTLAKHFKRAEPLTSLDVRIYIDAAGRVVRITELQDLDVLAYTEREIPQLEVTELTRDERSWSVDDAHFIVVTQAYP